MRTRLVHNLELLLEREFEGVGFARIDGKGIKEHPLVRAVRIPLEA